MRNLILIAAAAAVLAPAVRVAHAQSVCSSDNTVPPAAVVERFISADCEACWTDANTPKAGPRELALDWVVPTSKGEDAPLSVVARDDALQRLKALGRKPPARSDSVRARVSPVPNTLRVAHGLPFNDYIGTSIELEPGRGGPWRPWLLLVEALPTGAAGSPVPRNLVRNAFVPDWQAKRAPSAAELDRLAESRAMQIHEGVKPARLKVVALLEDARGRLRAIAESVCRPEGGRQ